MVVCLSYSLLLLLSNLFKRHASLTQQYPGLQEGRVQRKIAIPTFGR